MRVARTEVNMAYQASDSERWTRSWWIKGIRVSLSNNHTSLDSKGRPTPLVDICDELAGDYPADFKFTGWHPQCRCFATAITCEYSDIRDYYKRKRAGEDMTGYTPPGAITEPPEQFKRWMADNNDRLAGAAKRGTTPYFIANNAKYTDPNWKPGKAMPESEPQTKIPLEGARAYQKVNLTEEGYDELVDRFGAGSIKFIDHTTFNNSPMAGLNIIELDEDIMRVLTKRGITIQHREYNATNASGLFVYIGNGIELERIFRIQNGVKTVVHSYFELDPKYQRKGLSKDLVKAMYRHYIGIGVEKIEVHAALDRGGYTWARYGFMANDKQQALAAITPPSYASPPDGLKKKAQALIEEFYKTHSDTDPFPIRVIAELKGADRLMSGSNWYGHIDLTKDEQRQYFEHYIGY